MDAVGTIVKFLTFAVTIGKVVTLNPLGGPAPTSPVLAASETETVGVVVSAHLSGVPLKRWARVRVVRPGSSNHGRLVLVPAEEVADD